MGLNALKVTAILWHASIFIVIESKTQGERILQYSFIWKDNIKPWLSAFDSYIDRWLKRESEQFTNVTVFLIHQSHCNFTYKYRLGSERLIDSGSFKCIMFVLTPAQMKIEWFQTSEWSRNWNYSFETARTDQCKIKFFWILHLENINFKDLR